MHTHHGKIGEHKNSSIAGKTPLTQLKHGSTTRFADHRPEMIAQRKLKNQVENTPHVLQQKAFQEMANESPQIKQAAQLQSMATNYLAQQELPIQRQEKNTGLPHPLKSGIESLSGYTMDDVKVHYNSSKPAQLQAHAYAQGTDIHLGTGQEKHLPHEAWHVVQQKQGRVQPTLQMKGKVNINDDSNLEKEADVMGVKALQMAQSQSQLSMRPATNQHEGTIQRVELPHRSKDKALDTYKAALVALVEKNAQAALSISNIPSDSGGYLDRWAGVAAEYLDDTSKVPDFLHAAYGYAVETLTNSQLKDIENLLPVGWSWQCQVTQGMTRPDIVIFDDNKNQVAWLDITSDGSPGHIFKKASGGWKSKDYVSEILYPALKLGDISNTGGMVEGIKLRRKFEMTKRKEALALEKLIEEIKNIYSLYDVSTMPNTKQAFEDHFDGFDFSHNMIRSLIELGHGDLAKFGYKRANANGRDKAAAMDFINAHYVNNITLFSY